MNCEIKLVRHDDSKDLSPHAQALKIVVPLIFKAITHGFKTIGRDMPDLIEKIDTRDYIVSLISTMAINLCVMNIDERQTKEGAITQSKEVMDDIRHGFYQMIEDIINNENTGIGQNMH